MKTLMSTLIAALFGLSTAYAVASPITGTTRLSDDEKKTEETEKKQDYKQEQLKATSDGDERENTDEKKSD
jgi:hemolysin activation/secretion protein